MKKFNRGGFVGKNYDSKLTTKEIARKLRFTFQAKRYNGYKFSVRTDYNEITVRLMQSPVFIYKFITDDIIQKNRARLRNETYEQCKERLENRTKMNGITFYEDEKYLMNEEVFDLMMEIKTFIKSYNYDDSDSQIDYFDVNFYFRLEIGRWDKPAIVK
jgi:hypothetical protein